MARPQQTLSLAPPRQTVVVAGPDRRGSYLCLRRLLVVFSVVNISVSHPRPFYRGCLDILSHNHQKERGLL